MVDTCMCGHSVNAHHFRNGLHGRCGHIDCNCGCYFLANGDPERHIPTNVEAMQDIIAKIAKLNLDISKLQMQVIEEYHELHTRLQRVKMDLKS